jgi:hypothetical protein
MVDEKYSNIPTKIVFEMELKTFIILVLVLLLAYTSMTALYFSIELCQRVCGVCNGGFMTSFDFIGGRTGYGCQCGQEIGCTVME